jgi:hypothetical protein
MQRQQNYRHRQERYVAELQAKLAAANSQCKAHEQDNAELQRSLSSVIAEREELAEQVRKLTLGMNGRGRGLMDTTESNGDSVEWQQETEFEMFIEENEP